MTTRIAAWALLAIAVMLYALPVLRGEDIVWLRELEGRAGAYTLFPFFGYIFPTLMLALFAVTLSPWLLASDKMPEHLRRQVKSWSTFCGLLLVVVAIVYAIWVAVTPVFG